MKLISASLVKAQKGFAPALKASINPHFKSKYVDLAGCVEAVIDSLNSNGIALIQRTTEDQTGVTVETVFLHESGEMLECGKLHVPASKQDAQGFGSALTYARRYSLMSACGIAPEDDDGNAASRKGPTLLDKYRTASLQGMQALKAFHESQASSEEKVLLWKQHGESLKKAADAADIATTV
jgi:hypothetical protein